MRSAYTTCVCLQSRLGSRRLEDSYDANLVGLEARTSSICNGRGMKGMEVVVRSRFGIVS